MASVTVNVRIDSDELLSEVDHWAEAEMRSRSLMIRVLLVEALAERKRIVSLAPSPTAARIELPHPSHPFTAGKNPLKCGLCGVAQGRHS